MTIRPVLHVGDKVLLDRHGKLTEVTITKVTETAITVR